MSFALWSVPIATALAYAPHFIRVRLCQRAKAYKNSAPRDLDGQLKGVEERKRALVQRLAASHQNQLELLGVYAGGIAACMAVGVPTARVNSIAALYVGSRVAYNVAYALPQMFNGYIRTLTFTGAMLGAIYAWGAAAARYAAFGIMN